MDSPRRLKRKKAIDWSQRQRRNTPRRKNMQMRSPEVALMSIPHGSASFRRLGPSNEPLAPRNASSAAKESPKRQRRISTSTRETLVTLVAATSWFLCSFSTIITAKTLLSTWKVPPMLLTLQELFFSAVVLQGILSRTDGGVRGWLWDSVQAPRLRQHMDFVLASLFNSLDFLATNAGFNLAAASFVETVKASEPITTTMVALLWRVDRLQWREGLGLGVLILGVMLSTYGNASARQNQPVAVLSMREALRTSVTVASANLAFAFRAMSQKMYRKFDPYPLDDMNLLCQMLYVGALAISVPTFFLHMGLMLDALVAPVSLQLQYMALSTLNTTSFVIQNYAACYMLSKLSVLQFSGLNCLRRMLAILTTSIFFAVPITRVGSVGLCLSFIGFGTFSYYRAQRPVAPTRKNTRSNESLQDMAQHGTGPRRRLKSKESDDLWDQMSVD